MRQARTTLVCLAAFAALAVAPESANAGGLSKAEKKAVDIKGLDAFATPSAALIEARFRGNLEAELGTGGLRRAQFSVELSSPTGPPTTITDRKRSRKAKEDRSGTDGRFDVIRDERRVLVLVEELPEHPTRVLATTSMPGKPGGRGPVSPILDSAEALLGDVPDCDEIEAEIEDAQEELPELLGERANRRHLAEKLVDKLHRAQRRLIEAKSGAAARDAREAIDKIKAEMKENLARLEALSAQIKAIKRWVAELEKALENCVDGGGVEDAQCSDGVDNGDPEDAIADHPADPGCVDGQDNDEKDTTVPVTCPAAGGDTSSFAVINTPQTNAFTSMVLRKQGSGALVLDTPVTGTSGGPASLPGNICGAGVTTTFQYVVFTDGDPYSLPDSPPGEHGFCVFIFVDNPMGSGNPGGQDATLQFAVGTTPN